MPAPAHILHDSILIAAPIDRCFLLSTHIDTVRQTLALTPVAGRTSGHILMGDRVTWRGWKFLFPQVHHTLITAYTEPTFFQDTQEKGRFAAFQHDHHLAPTAGGTLLEDEVRFTLPFGPLGRLVAHLILIPHIRTLLRKRFRLLKRLAETEAWRHVLNEQPNVP